MNGLNGEKPVTTGPRSLKPYLLFLKVLLIIAGAEFLVMVLLAALDIEDGFMQSLADSLMLSLLSAPFLYYWVIRVVSRNIQAEARLKQEALERELVHRALLEKIAMKQYSKDIAKSMQSYPEREPEAARDGAIKPYVLFLNILLIIAVAEFLVMVLLSVLEIEEGVTQFMTDSLVLSVLSAPFLYYWVVRVVSRNIRTEARLKQEAVERELINTALMEKIALKQHSEDIIQSVPSGIAVVSKEHMVVSTNHSFHRILMKDENRGEVLGRPVEDVLPGAGFKEAVHEVFETGEARDGIPFEMKDGERVRYLLANITLIQSSEAESDKQALIVIDDITRRKEDEKTILMMAYYDALTGLPNRRMLLDRLDHALADAGRTGVYAALFFMDLDRFKFINDTLGHEAGDELLIEVAERLKRSIRAVDTVSRPFISEIDEHPAFQSTVARLGGDEFVILLPEIPKDENIVNVANRILACFEAPFSLKGREIFVTTSIGVSMFPIDGEGVEELIKKADQAMYWAKEEGRNNCKIYNTALDSKRKDWLSLERKLHKALEGGEFVLHYQPQVSAVTGDITCLESHIRWQDPETGLIFPERFIPIAEETGLIIPITTWVLKTACAQANAWRLKGFENIRVAVIISMRQFKEKEFLSKLSGVLKETGLPPESLEIELTEEIVMTDAEHALKILQALKEIGVRLSIDDFGTGFSSLIYLKSMPIDVIRIDQSFISGMSLDVDDVAIITATIRLAHSFGCEVVAKGVETAGQAELLKKLDCDSMQGYLFARPSDAKEVEGLLEDRRLLKSDIKSGRAN